METCAQIGEECKNFSYWSNSVTMDLNRGMFEVWNLSEDIGKLVA